MYNGFSLGLGVRVSRAQVKLVLPGYTVMPNYYAGGLQLM